MLDRLLEDKKRGARIAYICDHNTQYRMLSLDGIIDALTLATNDALRAERAERIIAALRRPSESVVTAVCIAEDWQDFDAVANIISAAVAAAEQEVGR